MKLIETIGNTPLVELKSPNPKVRIFAKLEGTNPGGSVKDRAALNMIRSAIESGAIKVGDTLIEATSGNTGIALAMVAAQFGVKIILVMPDNSTEERKQTMRAFGAELLLTPGEKTIEYSRRLAIRLAKENGYRLLNQFDNEDNWKAHYKTTGPEIWRDTDGEITHFVSAMGTTGTIMGTSKFLKEQSSDIQIVGAQPANGASIPGIRKWSIDMRPGIFSPERIDQTVDVGIEDAENATRYLAQEEGVFAGVSSGGAYFVAQQVATEITEGLIVFIACDRGDRYLSSNVFASEELVNNELLS
ncbi:MAG: cysteine synthase CysM [Crocinitomicaceae bacterium]|nr:cysteine synthase CysM [Crocinitomicaceae bacterium]